MRNKQVPQTVRQSARAFSLIEVVITIGILSVMALGAMSYQYYAIRQVKRAGVKMAATRLGMLVLENWRMQGGGEYYDPTILDQTAWKVPNREIYVFTVEGTTFYLEMSASDIQSYEETGVTLRELSVSTTWRNDSAEGLPRDDDPVSTFTTMVRRDQAGG